MASNISQVLTRGNKVDLEPEPRTVEFTEVLGKWIDDAERELTKLAKTTTTASSTWQGLHTSTVLYLDHSKSTAIAAVL